MIVWLTEIQMEQQLNDSLSMQYFVINIFSKKISYVIYASLLLICDSFVGIFDN